MFPCHVLSHSNGFSLLLQKFTPYRICTSKLMGTYKKTVFGCTKFIMCTSDTGLSVEVLPNFLTLEITNLRDQLYSIAVFTQVTVVQVFTFEKFQFYR